MNDDLRIISLQLQDISARLTCIESKLAEGNDDDTICTLSDIARIVGVKRDTIFRRDRFYMPNWGNGDMVWTLSEVKRHLAKGRNRLIEEYREYLESLSALADELEPLPEECDDMPY